MLILYILDALISHVYLGLGVWSDSVMCSILKQLVLVSSNSMHPGNQSIFDKTITYSHWFMFIKQSNDQQDSHIQADESNCYWVACHSLQDVRRGGFLVWQIVSVCLLQNRVLYHYYFLCKEFLQFSSWQAESKYVWSRKLNRLSSWHVARLCFFPD